MDHNAAGILGRRNEMEEKKLIEFRNIVKSFDGQIVLKGINLDIFENEFVTLLGPSGCEKKSVKNHLMKGNSIRYSRSMPCFPI